MAIPTLYWMLECTGCGNRFVVYDSYLKFVGISDADAHPGAGYEGPPLPERHRCPGGCASPLKTIASIFHPADREMWLHKPHVPVEMTKVQAEEWKRLLREAGLVENPN
jgi:hypothetical protein